MILDAVLSGRRIRTITGLTPTSIHGRHCQTYIRKDNWQPENFTCRTEVKLYCCLAAIYLTMIISDKKIPKRLVSCWLASPVLLPPYMQNTGKKILIVDENEASRESLGASIKRLGYEVFEAATGPDAINKASSMRPDLIIMDLRLPGMNGDEATARLKRNLSTRNIPVVISTAWTTMCNIGDRVDRALEAGAEEILYKPLQLTVLRDVLRTYLFA